MIKRTGCRLLRNDAILKNLKYKNSWEVCLESGKNCSRSNLVQQAIAIVYQQSFEVVTGTRRNCRCGCERP